MIDVFIGYALLASAITTNKILLAYLPATFFVAIRMLCAGFLLIALHVIQKRRFHKDILGKDLLTVLGIAIATTFVPSILKAYGLQNMPSAKASFLGALDPFVTALYAYILYNERLTFYKILGIIIGFSGTMILLYGSSSAEQSLHAWWIFSWPELAALGAVVISRYGWMKAGELLKQERYGPAELNGFMQLAGGFFALGASWYQGTCVPFAIPLTSKFLSLFAYTVVMGNMVAYTLYARFLKMYSVTFVVLAGLLIPLFVQLYGPFALGEPLTLNFFVALSVTFLGMYLFYHDELRQEVAKSVR